MHTSSSTKHSKKGSITYFPMLSCAHSFGYYNLAVGNLSAKSLADCVALPTEHGALALPAYSFETPNKDEGPLVPYPNPI